MNSYNIQENEKVPIIRNWLGHKGLRFVETLNGKKQEKCQTCFGLLKVLSAKFKMQHDETIVSLQYCKLVREEESAEELMDHLIIKANKCEYKERDGSLKEQFINEINDDDMMTEIIRELTE